jgi:hypothetical protein
MGKKCQIRGYGNKLMRKIPDRVKICKEIDNLSKVTREYVVKSSWLRNGPE